MSRVSIALLALLALLVPTVATAAPPDEPAWFVDASKLPFDGIPGLEAEQYWGIEQGAGYRMEVPTDWNGSLVMWAHGFRGDGLELTVDNHPLRPYLLANGFAWAASSFSANGYAVGAGVRDTERLTRVFRHEVGRPDTTYVTGASMGGHVTARSIEQYPSRYDGAMPICGVLADNALFDYFLDYNVLAQQLALGTSTYPPGPDYLTTTVPEIQAELEAVPGGWPVALDADGEAFKQAVELRSGGDRPNFDQAWSFWNSFPSFGGSAPGDFLFGVGASPQDGIAVDNTDVAYQLDLDPAISDAEATLDDAIVRVSGDPDLRNAMSPNLASPLVTGDIDVPVLSLHNLGDLFVPFHNEVVYAHEVADAGKSELLVQRAIRGVNHCGFTATELTTAFDDLVTWVEDGVRPEGDDVRDPAAVAAPDYGCRFTDFATPGGHLLAAPCPG
ncbi:hypothetical protein [Salsipaludibacter albus]|uniref:hypothetical protein n=1 Tax=Salsipaludibacter albus TaxID=2849650 RepID=UPI001EE429C5|nr:hypothetical protein [Salsipaludibacter albus]MBY5163971.1 hypothetical protein [Salsipaludibacter albus]